MDWYFDDWSAWGVIDLDEPLLRQRHPLHERFHPASAKLWPAELAVSVSAGSAPYRLVDGKSLNLTDAFLPSQRSPELVQA